MINMPYGGRAEFDENELVAQEWIDWGPPQLNSACADGWNPG